MNEPLNNSSNIIIYQTEDGLTRINVKVEDDTVWLSQQQMAELFQCSRTNVVEHIKNIYEEGELAEEASCRNSDRFDWKVIERLIENCPFITLAAYWRRMSRQQMLLESNRQHGHLRSV